MQFEEVGVSGSFLVTPERRSDERGYFARIHCEQELAERRLAGGMCQINSGFSPRTGTLRGMHYQVTPRAEAKLVRCTAGAIYDVIVDLRPDSGTFKRRTGVELNADNRYMLYIPEGIAHGFLTLSDDAEVLYQMSEYYSAEHARSVRWNDPTFGIQWPGEVLVISDRDRSYPDFSA